ncbi:hypothetical protein BGW36DRAFT_395593 [Talaromyces proteolyticus]|uniref:DnaJ homologue subfamily C member 28 conserved domain-containing protein n=1 Tax=Talaromyces proteolyticus TaxID=1131652 RepID=A0AAD4Q073_9EURO|nr:uncharacterized protein BGW36DRAFT_395593 [Talaromyces proteolyticus]KAH8700519.1 hypothetical protein BGW36DRAFT_395593 [Talaromyces proteolyticus]
MECVFLAEVAQRCLSIAKEARSRFQRPFSAASPLRQNEPPSNGSGTGEKREEGALSRRLSEMTEEAFLEGGRSARKNIEEAGFSDDLKKQLEEKIKMSTFKSENAGAFSVVNMPASAGKGTQDIAAATPWHNTESIHDTALRMLDDSKKPIKLPYQIPKPAMPVNVDMRPAPKTRQSTGSRLASARDRTHTYALSQSPGLSDEERESVRKELRSRFEPGARSLPMSIQGLTSLANERIEDAIARGQFKNLPRGKGKNTETDPNASSAFIDTTEYFMNKIIQKQEIVPPWIEKQQELAREVDRFRQRLRTEWRRHAARLIASQGGTLEQQQIRARGYAAAEARLTEKSLLDTAFTSSDVDKPMEPSFSQISHDGRLSNPVQSPANVVSSEQKEPLPHVAPLRDPDFMALERGLHQLQIKALNDLTRSYNLQAPRLAQKPYLNLERELNACYADVAPSLAGEIVSRTGHKVQSPMAKAHRRSSGGILDDLLQNNQRVQIYEENRYKHYGLKELWRDLWKR